MRGAGCTINDMWDRDFDKKVASPWEEERLPPFLQTTLMTSPESTEIHHEKPWAEWPLSHRAVHPPSGRRVAAGQDVHWSSPSI